MKVALIIVGVVGFALAAAAAVVVAADVAEPDECERDFSGWQH